ncbi:hypothetical protein K9L97_00565 [Candidatus Woesearchaeota archaeon]|nr:hypothetical protein [Candidatus Woesearchaeota archaeon]
MVKENNNTGLYLVAIVAIVAVAGLAALLIQGNRGAAVQVPQTAVSEADTLGGQAIRPTNDDERTFRTQIDTIQCGGLGNPGCDSQVSVSECVGENIPMSRCYLMCKALCENSENTNMFAEENTNMFAEENTNMAGNAIQTKNVDELVNKPVAVWDFCCFGGHYEDGSCFKDKGCNMDTDSCQCMKNCGVSVPECSSSEN